MSEEGLIRGLLYDGMQQLPKLCRTVFARRWEAFAILGDKTTWEEPWTIYELQKAFQALIEEATKSGKVFILIDGLDEFNGTFPEQRKLIKNITSLSGPMVKMCLSSRPWNVFQDAFKRLPSLRLEDLTYSDIMKYTSSKLSDDEGFAALKQVNQHAADNHHGQDGKIDPMKPAGRQLVFFFKYFHDVKRCPLVLILFPKRAGMTLKLSRCLSCRRFTGPPSGCWGTGLRPRIWRRMFFCRRGNRLINSSREPI